MQKIKLIGLSLFTIILMGCEFFTPDRMVIENTVVGRPGFSDFTGIYDGTILGRGEKESTHARIIISDRGKRETLPNGRVVDLLDITYAIDQKKPENILFTGTLALSEIPKISPEQNTLYLASVLLEVINDAEQKQKKYVFFIIQKNKGDDIMAAWIPNSESKAIKAVQSSPYLLPPDQSFKTKKQDTRATLNWVIKSGREYPKHDTPYIFQKH